MRLIRNYSERRIKVLVEDFDRWKERKGTEPSRLYHLIELADLDCSMKRLPPKYYQAVLLCGLLNINYTTAGVLLGVSDVTMRKRYIRGLEWLFKDLNGAEAY